MAKPKENNELKEIARQLALIPAGLSRWADAFLRKASTIIAGRSIGKYMKRTRARNIEARSPNDPLRILTARLSRSLASRGRILDSGGAPEGIMRIIIMKALFRLIKGSEVPYAEVHEKGFEGDVNIPSHKRRITQAWGRQVAPRETTVRAHSRHMNIAKRSYLGPAIIDVTPRLQRESAKDLRKFVADAINGGAPGGA